MEILPRSAWGAVPPDRITALPPSALRGVTVHWFGSPQAAATHAGCDDLLRSVQRTHMGPGGLGVAEGGADIAYNHAVCPHGTVYELRGFGVQTGANGTTAGNTAHAAIVYMAGEGDPLTDPGKIGLNFLIAEWRRRGTGLEVSPHRRWTGSECPGPTIRTWLTVGRPAPEEEDMPPWFPAWWKWRLLDGNPATRPDTAPDAIPQKYLDLVKVAEEFRAAKPDSSLPELATLRSKLSQIHTLSA